jgi:hypothetical protein
MGLPYFSDGHLNTNVQLNIENRNAGLNLEGGTIGIISLYGTITATVDGVS